MKLFKELLHRCRRGIQNPTNIEDKDFCKNSHRAQAFNCFRMKLHPKRLDSAQLGFEYAPGCCRVLNAFVNSDDIQLSKISTTTQKQRSLESFI